MTLPGEEISRQVAVLLNGNNQLKTKHTSYSVLNRKGAYFVDVVGGQVIGCSAILKESDQVTKQFHLCVHPDYRRQGIARKLKMASLAQVSTPYAYVTIREDNIASINLNTSLGFTLVKKDWAGDHNVLTLGRMMHDDRPGSNGMVDEKRIYPDPRAYTPSKLFYTGT